jgi:hypothetical protein
VVAALDSSKTSDRRMPSGGVNYLSSFAELSRLRGHRGGVISMHRALTRFVLGPRDLTTSGVLVLLISFVWAVSLPQLCRFWQYVLTVGLRTLALRADLGLSKHQVASAIRFAVPYPRMVGAPPDSPTWWLTASVVILLLAASFFLPTRLTPVKYLLRAALFIQATGLAYFMWAPGRFPHTPDSYLEGLMGYAIALISFVPILFGLTYYIFDFGLVKKALLTVMTMTHLSLFLPLQILLQAAWLEKSVLFMPLLYIVFGLPVDVLIILAFYSWGMSWSMKPRTES